MKQHATIEIWYQEVKEKANGPRLMILDNSCAHELDVILPGVRFEFLPPRLTAKYQPLDLGLIENGKIRYRSILLRCVILMIEGRAAGRTKFTEDFGLGKKRICEGQLRHVADEMEMFTESCKALSRNSVLRCWKKSQCLSEMHGIINGITDENANIIDLTVGTV